MALCAVRYSCYGLVCVGAWVLAGCDRNSGGPANSGPPNDAASATRAASAPPAGVPATDAVVTQQISKRAEVAQQGGQLEVKLNFAGKPFSDADLAKVPLNDAVTEINLSNTQITDEGLAHLKRAQNLTTVNLDDTKITDKGLEHLKELPKLQWVELMGNPQISTEAYDNLQKVLLPRRPNP